MSRSCTREVAGLDQVVVASYPVAVVAVVVVVVVVIVRLLAVSLTCA